MSSKARKEQASRALASAHAAKRALSPPPFTLPSESTIIRATEDHLAAVRGEASRSKRSTRKKLDVRDQRLEAFEIQLEDTTSRYTAALQENTNMRVLLDGMKARNDLLVSSFEHQGQLLGAAQSNLIQCQHALKMALSDLSQTSAQDAGKAARLAELTCEVRLLRARAQRTRSKRSLTTKQPLPVFKVKERGEIPLAVRVAVLRLVGLGIGIKHVFSVIKCIAGLLEIVLKGRLSPASIQNIIHEGGVAAHLQVAEAMHDAKSECQQCTHLAPVLIHINFARRDYQQRQHINQVHQLCSQALYCYLCQSRDQTTALCTPCLHSE